MFLFCKFKWSSTRGGLSKYNFKCFCLFEDACLTISLYVPWKKSALLNTMIKNVKTSFLIRAMSSFTCLLLLFFNQKIGAKCVFLAGNCYHVNVNINIMLYWLQVDHFCQSNRRYCALLVAVNKLFQSYNWFRNGKAKHTHSCTELSGIDFLMKRTKLKVTIFLSKIISTCHLTVWHYLCACFNLTVN